MLGYTYATEQLAINARTACATYAGFPNPSGDTLYWVDYNYLQLDNLFYIQYVDGLENVLGSPSEFIITLPEL